MCFQSIHYWPMFERSTLLIHYAYDVCRRAQLQLTMEMRSIGITPRLRTSGSVVIHGNESYDPSCIVVLLDMSFRLLGSNLVVDRQMTGGVFSLCQLVKDA